MSARFENIAVGDQVELPARRMPWIEASTRDPERPVRVFVVTHRWHDPVEKKDYVALAAIRAGGALSEPKEKRTIRGLAQAGYRPASQDWIAYAQAIEANEVIPLLRRRK